MDATLNFASIDYQLVQLGFSEPTRECVLGPAEIPEGVLLISGKAKNDKEYKFPRWDHVRHGRIQGHLVLCRRAQRPAQLAYWKIRNRQPDFRRATQGPI